MDPSSFNALELHETLVRCFRMGNHLRLRFIQSLERLQETRLYFQLGFPTIDAYCAATFDYMRSETREFLRVAKCLRERELSELEEAFSRGDINWSALKDVTRVAKKTTQGEWLEFVRAHNSRETRSEVRAAENDGRDRPRRGSEGMPNLRTRMSFELLAEERQLVQKALEKAGLEAAERRGGEPIESKDALLLVLRQYLETREGKRAEREPSDLSPFTIVYRFCESCRRAAVVTEAGPVEIDPEVVEREAEDAQKVEIRPEEEAPAAGTAPDEPSGGRRGSRSQRRREILRDGPQCANPHCHRRAAHSHHLQLVSENGPAEVWNAIGLCTLCHSLRHAGLLRIEGNPVDGFRFEPVSETLIAGLEKDLELLASLGVEPPAVPARTASEGGASARADARGAGPEAATVALSARADTGREENVTLESLARGMRSLGWRVEEARRRLAEAHAGLRAELGREPTAEELLAQAMRAAR